MALKKLIKKMFNYLSFKKDLNKSDDGLRLQYWPPLNKKCPDCGKKGYRTTLIEGKSYACKKCDIWWVVQ
jgi:hypothetical protein